MKTNRIIALVLLGIATVHPPLSTAFAQGMAFTYQGRLDENGVPVNRTYDLLFRPFNVPTGGTQLAFPNLRTVAISNGLFTTTLDFGAGIFNGDPLWLQIEISTNSFSGIVATLVPRQPLTPAPYAIFAANVTLANGQVDTPQLAAGAVTSGKVADGTLQPVDLNLDNFDRTFWKVGGNAGTSADFIGTTDDQPFDVRVHSVRVMRYRLATDATGKYTNAPNVIGGSPVNSALTTIVGATIGGGGGNISFDGRELDNRTTANFATVSGGALNLAGGDHATVGGGLANTASGGQATVGGGYGNTASGDAATVPGGFANTASKDFSFAAGYHAKADHTGSFVWADSISGDFHSAAVNQFAVRCTGGAKFVTATDGAGAQSAGVRLLAGENAWSRISDRNAKKNFSPVNAEAVLEKLAALPVQSWNYKWEADTNTPHLGPMAQDFKAAFYPGRDDKSISTLEFDGVELAAIQGLNQKLSEQETRLKQKDSEIQELRQAVAELQKIVGQITHKTQEQP